jgi:hypothetical protein
MKAKLARPGEAASAASNMQFVVDSGDDYTDFQKVCRSRWAALIKSKIPAAYHVGKSLRGGSAQVSQMRRPDENNSFHQEKDQADVIEKILRCCGLWREEVPKAPPPQPAEIPFERTYVPIDEFLANF